MNNEFTVAGRYKYYFDYDENNRLILVEVFNKNMNIVKSCFLEIEVQKNLINEVKKLKENDLVLISGHIESTFCKYEDGTASLVKSLIADKLVTKNDN